MRREGQRLRDILEAADFILRMLSRMTEQDLLEDPVAQSAVLYQLTVIGEAAGNLPDDLRNRYPAVRWRAMRGMRNVAVHAYFTVNWSRVWRTITVDLPEMRKDIAAILAAEFPPPDAG
jgi:uncharacterized protein with HEPN domain